MDLYEHEDDCGTEIKSPMQQMDEFLGHDAIQFRVDNVAPRRHLMTQQLRADALQSKICDMLRNEKMKISGLSERIKKLEQDDAGMFNYIRKLEFVQAGIWCTKCNAIKFVNPEIFSADCANVVQKNNIAPNTRPVTCDVPCADDLLL